MKSHPGAPTHLGRSRPHVNPGTRHPDHRFCQVHETPSQHRRLAETAAAAPLQHRCPVDPVAGAPSQHRCPSKGCRCTTPWIWQRRQRRRGRRPNRHHSNSHPSRRPGSRGRASRRPTPRRLRATRRGTRLWRPALGRAVTQRRSARRPAVSTLAAARPQGVSDGRRGTATCPRTLCVGSLATAIFLWTPPAGERNALAASPLWRRPRTLPPVLRRGLRRSARGRRPNSLPAEEPLVLAAALSPPDPRQRAPLDAPPPCGETWGQP
mmetsp:Transcript_35414/g.97762  ORF Transcript_35414/g.97762 Transcript_35414/m.97762 type:complete len:266 (+) Transcript_35414:585-1382(+)